MDEASGSQVGGRSLVGLGWGVFWCAILCVIGLFGCSAERGSSVGVLAGARIERSSGVTNAERLTDGAAPAEGTAWRTNRTAVFEGTRAFVVYDLGSERTIRSGALLGDNNDEYELSVSKDGQKFSPLWTTERVGAPGLRWRTTKALDASARYVRLRAKSGDRSLSVAEVALLEQASAPLPPSLRVVRAIEGPLDYRNALLVFLAFALLLVGVSGKALPLPVNLGLLGLGGWGLISALFVYLEARPLAELEVSLTRAVSATLAVGVVLRETYSSPRFRPFGAVSIGVLAISAMLAVLSFFNLGRPQFYDAKAREPSVVHNFDMRVYYPVAKYFDELRYDGLYLASTLSYAEEHGGLDTAELQRTELRDLKNHQMRRAAEIRPEIEAIKSRFSPERWSAFKKDMAYFWETMGPHAYLGSMRDHGGNATPLWLAITHLMFKGTTASNEVLLWAGALDPLLLLIFAVAAYRAFGIRTALVSLVIFGANDFYMFGSNWAGATLRNDWMVYLGLGACALRSGHYRTGGALLAFSALIRAFPAIALIALGIPLLYRVVETRLESGRFPTLRRIFEAEQWFFRTALGAAIFVAVAFVFSSAVLGPSSWPLWVAKISSFTASPHVNHIGLVTVTSGSEGNQAAVQLARLPLHVLLAALYAGLAVWAAKNRPPHVVALLGMLLMPVFMYPANYYIHFIFLLALLVDEPLPGASRFLRETSGKVWILLLGLCAAQYFTVKEQSLDLHFYNASVLLMSALLGVLVTLLPRDEQGLVVAPFAPPAGSVGRSPEPVAVDPESGPETGAISAASGSVSADPGSRPLEREAVAETEIGRGETNQPPE